MGMDDQILLTEDVPLEDQKKDIYLVENSASEDSEYDPNKKVWLLFQSNSQETYVNEHPSPDKNGPMTTRRSEHKKKNPPQGGTKRQASWLTLPNQLERRWQMAHLQKVLTMSLYFF